MRLFAKVSELNKADSVRKNVTLRRVRETIFAVEKQYILIIVRVCVALVIRYAMRMRHIVICGLPGLCNIFPHYLINGTN
jgi:hypothetical protein